MELKVKVTLGASGATFDVDVNGDVSVSDVKSLLDVWIAAVQAGDQAAIDAVTAKLKGSNEKLAGAVTENTPKT